MENISVLCIDDDPVVQTLLVEVLAPWSVICCLDLNSVRGVLSSSASIHAIVIDIDLPDGDGLRFLKQELQRFQNNNVPTFILSSHTDIAKKMMAFQFGADDFISKPFDPLELKFRLEARLKKAQQVLLDEKIIGDVVLKPQQYKAFQKSSAGLHKDLALTILELKILTLLSAQMDRIFTRNQIIDSVWGNVAITDRTVDSHIAHLRKKLKQTKIKIMTSQSVGYSATLVSGH